MANGAFIPLEDNVRIVVDSEYKLILSPEIENRVSDIWRKEKDARGNALFEGQIFNTIHLSPQVIRGHWISYRYALAAYIDPLLGNAMSILPTAVNGITRCSHKILLALRSQSVVAYSGYWELAPSGGVDPNALTGNTVDVRKSILDELVEETGIEENDVLSVSLFAAIHEEATLELCYLIDVHDNVIQRFDPPKIEYSIFEWVDEPLLKDFISSHRMLPLSTKILSFLYLNET